MTLADEARRGLLGKGAILMVTSHTDRTSPVVRGKWVLDNLLGAPPPPMPANVPPLDESAPAGRPGADDAGADGGRTGGIRCAPTATRSWTRSAWRWRTSTPSESWRTREGGTHGTAIDASGVLLDGTKVDGVVSLREALLRESRDLRRHRSSKS